MTDLSASSTASGTPHLQIEGLTKTYKTGKRALAGINLVINQPQVIAIIGSSTGLHRAHGFAKVPFSGRRHSCSI